MITRNAFISYLAKYPEAYLAVTEELSRHVTTVCEQLRTVALTSSVSKRLARLFLDWTEAGHERESSSRLRF